MLYCLLKFRRQITEAGDKAFFRCCRVCHISMFVFNSRFVRQSGFLRSAPFPLVENAEFSLSYPSPAGFRTCRRRSIVWSFIRRFPSSGDALFGLRRLREPETSEILCKYKQNLAIGIKVEFFLHFFIFCGLSAQIMYFYVRNNRGMIREK